MFNKFSQNNFYCYRGNCSKQFSVLSDNSISTIQIGPNLGIKIVSKSVTLYHLPTPER